MWCYGLSPPIKLLTFALCESNEVVLAARREPPAALPRRRPGRGARTPHDRHAGCDGDRGAHDGLIAGRTPVPHTLWPAGRGRIPGRWARILTTEGADH